MKTTKEEKLIALATLVGLGRSVEILKAMTEAPAKTLADAVVPPGRFMFAKEDRVLKNKRTKKILRPSP